MAKKRKPRRTPGSGSIRPVSGGKFKASYPNPAGGHWTKVHDSRAAAEGWLASFVQRKGDGLSLVGGQQPLSQWLDTWLAARPAHLKRSTLADYAFKIGYLEPLFNVALTDLTADAVDALMRELSTSLADTTTRQIRSLLSRALKEACRRRYISVNVAEAERTSAPRKKRAKLTLRPAQARALCEAADGFYAPAWPLLVCLGLRAAELCGLRRADIDLDAATLTIAQQWTDVRGQKEQGDPKYESVRTLPIPRAYLPTLRAHLDTLSKRERQPHYQQHMLIFPGRGGRPMHVTSLRHALKRLTSAASLPPVTTHQLRHTAAQALADAGCPEELRGAILGHTAANVTQDYARPTVEVMRPWVERAWSAVFGEAGAVRRSA